VGLLSRQSRFVLSAAWLIEHAGFHKGWIHGNVGLSTKHTLAIVGAELHRFPAVRNTEVSSGS
jgi:UDP-N-acetylenolpyruvoylglucosamine reductase